MPTTTDGQLFYPDGNVSNDYPAHMQQLAESVAAASFKQGSLENRPPAGVVGRRYLARTRVINQATVSWNVEYRDTGTSWVQLNDSNPVAFTPTLGPVPGESPSFNYAIDNVQGSATYITRRNTCFVNIHRLVQFFGTSGDGGIRMSLPIPPTGFASLSADVNNQLGRAQVSPDGTPGINIYIPSYSNNGRFFFDAQNRWFRISGEYPIG